MGVGRMESKTGLDVGVEDGLLGVPIIVDGSGV
jgi:hypothetical protein